MRTTMCVLVALVSLGGCSAHGGGPPPRSTAQPSAPRSTVVPSSGSPTPTRTGPLTTGAGVLPGERPPVEPPIARTKTNEGALTFAAYYKHALDWSLATSDAFLLRQVSAPTCATCNRYIISIENLRRGGGHVVGGRIQVDSVAIVQGHTLVVADSVVQVHTTQQPTAIALPSAAPSTVSTEPDHNTSFVYLTWTGSNWHVAGDFGP